MSRNKVLYEELMPDEFVLKVNECPIAYLPLGTLEWHSFHMPLGADGLQSKGIFERVAAEIGGIVLPMLFLGPDIVLKQEGTAYYGMEKLSFEDGYPQLLEGSAYYIEDERFVDLLDAIMHNLSRAGFKAVIGHGHGPSTDLFTKCKVQFKVKYGLRLYNLWELGYQGVNGIIGDHAAMNETSLVMALRPELVDMNKLPSDGTPLSVWGRDPRVFASAELGKQILDNNIAKISTELRRISADLPKGERNLRYHNVKSLLDDTSTK